MFKSILHTIVVVMCFFACVAEAKERLDGPVKADVVRVIDGDTVRVNAHIWLGVDQEVSIRLRGIQAPEIRRAKCEEEKALGIKAKEIISRAISNQPVNLHQIEHGKFSDRVIADISNHEGKDLATILLEIKLAKPSKLGKRKDWCGEHS